MEPDLIPECELNLVTCFQRVNYIKAEVGSFTGPPPPEKKQKQKNGMYPCSSDLH